MERIGPKERGNSDDLCQEDRDGIELAKRTLEIFDHGSIPQSDLDVDTYDGTESVEDHRRRQEQKHSLA